MKVRIIQIPYTGYISASWYNREESYLEQLEVFSNCSFLIAQNMLLHLRIVPYSYTNFILILHDCIFHLFQRHNPILCLSSNDIFFSERLSVCQLITLSAYLFEKRMWG